jgi:hypothetical protein
MISARWCGAGRSARDDGKARQGGRLGRSRGSPALGRAGDSGRLIRGQESWSQGRGTVLEVPLDGLEPRLSSRMCPGANGATSSTRLIGLVRIR